MPRSARRLGAAALATWRSSRVASSARARGYAVVDEELELGLVGAAAPVRGFDGRVVAAVNVSAPKFRLGRRLDAAGRAVREAAADVSARLGAA